VVRESSENRGPSAVGSPPPSAMVTFAWITVSVICGIGALYFWRYINGTRTAPPTAVTRL
jgi:hypothetical protein